MTNVKGKWALITGANRGIGYRIAKFMAGKGCNLILHSRSLEHTKDVLAEVQALGAQVFAGMTLEAAVKKAADFPQLFK